MLPSRSKPKVMVGLPRVWRDAALVIQAQGYGQAVTAWVVRCDAVSVGSVSGVGAALSLPGGYPQPHECLVMCPQGLLVWMCWSPCNGIMRT